MSKKIFWLVISVLFVVSLVGFGLFVLQISQTNTVNQEYQIAIDRIIEVETINTTLTEEKKVIEDKVSELQTSLTEKEQIVSELQLSVQNNEKTIAGLENKIHCGISEEYIFDLSSQSSVSESLKTYIGDTSGKVVTATWDMVWNNAKTAKHELTTEEYLFVFIVDFEDTEMGRRPSILDVGDMCFINPNQFK